MLEENRVHPALATALQNRGYETLTPVQEAVIAEGLDERDLLVSAQTGSGKTVAFGMAIAPTLLGEETRFTSANAPAALVVAPTRELALQVKRELEWLYAQTGAKIASCVGGMDIRTERRALERGVHIVVGTPGRLRDHIMRKALNTSQMQAVVLDEADEMLDLGFREDLEFILEATPEERRTLLFSATVPPMIAKLAKSYQRDAERITTTEEKKQHVDIEYRAFVTAPRERENAIINVLRYYEAQNAIVFCNTRASVNHMVARLNNRGFSVVALSGELSQNERTHALQAMRDGRARVCVATDVAARGIDLPNLELVVHAELPSNPDTLLHRSGRTGRAGRKGVSAMMVDVKGRNRVERLLRFAKLNAEWVAPPSADDVNRRDEERLLTDPMMTEPISEDEADFVSNLTDQFTHEQIAAAFLRLSRAGKSAPEDIQILDVNAPQKRDFKDRGDRPERGAKKQREEFENSVWVSLSVGRKQNAEPRWLIPLICNAGDITKREIGMIKMQNDETFVQLNADKSDSFFDMLGANQTLEKNVRVKRLEGKPKFDNAPNSRGEKPFKKPKKEHFSPEKEEKTGKFEGKREEKPFRKPKNTKPHRGKGPNSKNPNDTFQSADGEFAPKPKRKFVPKSAPNSGGPDAVLTGKPKHAKKPKISKAESDAKAKAGWAKKKPKGVKKKPKRNKPKS